MRKVLSLGALLALVLGSVAPALAQSGAATGQGTTEREMKSLDGTVRAVDKEAKAIRVSNGLLGLGDTTLQVTDQTRIRIQGREGSVADLKEGDRIRASYMEREGINVAQTIEVGAEGQDAPRSTPGTPPSRPGTQSQPRS
jgi:hypothetical protein